MTSLVDLARDYRRTKLRWFDFDGGQYAWRIARDAASYELIRRNEEITRKDGKSTSTIVATFATLDTAELLIGTHRCFAVVLSELRRLDRRVIAARQEMAS